MNGNGLQQAIKGGQFVILGECLPPRGASADAIKACATELGGKVHAIGAVESEDGARLSSLAACSHLAAAGAEPILHLLTRDMNRIALQATILGVASMGVRNIFCTAGRHQILTGESHARGVFDVDPVQLIGIADGITKGHLAGGQSLDAPVELLLGTDTNPYAQPMELQLLTLERAVAAGADFIVTQPVFRLDKFSTWMEQVRQRGIASKTCIIASIRPLVSADTAADLRETHKAFDIPEELISKLKDASDPRAAGIETAAQTIADIRKVDGVRGIYLMTGEDYGLAADLIAASGLSRS